MCVSKLQGSFSLFVTQRCFLLPSKRFPSFSAHLSPHHCVRTSQPFLIAVWQSFSGVTFPFSISVLAVPLRTADLPVLGLSSKPSLRDYFFTQHLLLCNIFDVSGINIPEDLKIEACARLLPVSKFLSL